MNALKHLVSLCTFLLLASSFSFAAEEREIQIHGEFDSKLHISADLVSISGGPLNGASISKTSGSPVLQSKDGKTLSSAKIADKGELQLLDPNGKTLYTIQSNEKGYLLLDESKALRNRVKIKEDKFNLYDAADKRLLHGKQKPDGWGVKDEQDNQTLKVKGARSLEEVSYFALPIPLEYRLLAWMARN